MASLRLSRDISFLCLQVMDYSHWDYNTDDEDDDRNDISTDDEAVAASVDNRDQ